MYGAILCGGRSLRMGRPKALLPWYGGTLLSHASDRLRAAGLEPVLLGPAAWAAECGMSWLPDEMEDAGPLGGILSVLRSRDAFVLAVDVPLLRASEIAALAEAGRASGLATVPLTADGPQPLTAFWPGTLREPLSRYLASGRRSVRDFLAPTPHRLLGPEELALLGIDPAHLMNVNTPEEYRAVVEAGP